MTDAGWSTKPGGKVRDELKHIFALLDDLTHTKSDGPVTEHQMAKITSALEVVPPPSNASSPDVEGSLEGNSHDELRSELETIYAKTKAEDYSKVQARLLELEFAINKRRLWAPFARPKFSIPAQAKERRDFHKLIQQDRVLIDCHWLHLHAKRQAVKEAKWRPLLDPRVPFPLELAKEFSTRAIKSTIRADEILCLSPFQQAQLRTMAGREMRQARKMAETATPNGHSPLGIMLRVINRWASHDQRVEVEKYEALARAITMLGNTKYTNSELGALAGFLVAQPADKESALRGMRGRLEAAMKRYT